MIRGLSQLFQSFRWMDEPPVQLGEIQHRFFYCRVQPQDPSKMRKGIYCRIDVRQLKAVMLARVLYAATHDTFPVWVKPATVRTVTRAGQAVSHA